ncbi:hypothetical protein HYH02_012881 [Chlamydomonas schloesseri]|uniref:Ribosomal protein L27 n=1 Tax=Chlamydomonas schloesseri TaxID=2026947 RepID=A0A835VXA6_9CHLO|nr:hypothetical protein HYH02_012881 [Chlamydomonas schloesseri]|eukprot:KAG2432747.1 hypothetical protein HYH02_012881 [Chlamydomonas schloesseri]
MKLTAGELAFPGMIILRQRGSKFHPGTNVGIGRDHTIFATGVGKVRVDTQPGPRGERRVISVEPLPEALAAASAPAIPGAVAEADSALRLRQVEAELVKRRAEVKRAMLQGRTPLEPALYFPLPRTSDGRMSWLERTVPKVPPVGLAPATAAKDAAPAKPKASAKKAAAAAAAS